MSAPWGRRPGPHRAAGEESLPEDDRGRPGARPEGSCANHPDRPAEAACADCGKALCPECFYASGGGHAFCKECMEGSRLVDAEPQLLGRVVETGEPASARVALLAVLAALGLAVLLAAVLLLWALLGGTPAG